MVLEIEVGVTHKVLYHQATPLANFLKFSIGYLDMRNDSRGWTKMD